MALWWITLNYIKYFIFDRGVKIYVDNILINIVRSEVDQKNSKWMSVRATEISKLA